MNGTPTPLSPFSYGGIVRRPTFTNRRKEIELLKANLLSGQHTCVISPRRWGKSSLIEHVGAEISKEKQSAICIFIDMYNTSNEEEFLNLFAKEIIKSSSSKWEDWVQTSLDFFKNLIPKISFGSDPSNDFALSFEWDSLRKHRDEILQLPELVAKKKNRRIIICLDEFQNLVEFKNYKELEKSMRAIWQRQANVSYCLYGSKRHLMAKMLSNPSKPFYKFGDLMWLDKIALEDWQRFIIARFRSTSKSISKPLATSLAKIMDNHPWYVQQLAHYVWLRTEDKAKVNHLRNAMEELIRTNSPFYIIEDERLSKTQRNLIKAILSKATKLTSVAVMNQYQLGTPRNVSKNIQRLLGKDMLEKKNTHYEVLDPGFKIWFEIQYLGRDLDSFFEQ